MKRTLFVSGAILAVLSSVTFAQLSEDEDKEDDRPTSFETLDQNSNGVLEEGEVMAAQDDHDLEGVEFETLDENNDGEVSRQEWTEYSP